MLSLAPFTDQVLDFGGKRGSHEPHQINVVGFADHPAVPLRHPFLPFARRLSCKAGLGRTLCATAGLAFSAS